MADFVVLTSFASRADADFASAILGARGIQAVVSAGDVSGWDPFLLVGSGGAKLLVSEQDLERARRILRRTDEGTP